MNRRQPGARVPSPVGDPVTTSAPLVLRRYPALFVAVLVAAASVVYALAAAPALVVRSGDAALRAAIDAVPATAPAARRPGVRAVLPTSSAAIERHVAAELTGLSGGADPVVSRIPTRYRDFFEQAVPRVTNPRTGDSEVIVPYSRDGAIDALQPVEQVTADPGAGSGVWIPDLVADALNLAPADRVEVSLDVGDERIGTTTVTVSGVYRTIDGDGRPADAPDADLWNSIAVDLPSHPYRVPRDTDQVPLLVADEATFRSLVDAIGERTLLTWDVSLEPTTLAAASALDREARRLSEEFFSPTGATNAPIRAETDGVVEVSGGLGPLVGQARSAQAATSDGVAAVRVLALGLSMVVVGLVAYATARRRSTERHVLLDGGRAPSAVALLTAVESLVPVAMGVALGWRLTQVTAGRLIPGPNPEAVPWVIAVWSGVAVVTLLAAGAFIDAHRRVFVVERGVATNRRIAWRTPLVLGAAAAVATIMVDPEPSLGAVEAAAPILVLAATAALVGSMVTVAARRLTFRWSTSTITRRRLVGQLVVARIARDTSVLAVYVTVATSIGAVAFATTMSDGLERAVVDKARTRAAATSTVRIPTTAVFGPGLPTALPDATAAVWTLPRVFLRERETIDVLAIDPRTFDRAVPDLPDDARSVIADHLAGTRHDDGALPAITVGSVPPSGTMRRPSLWEIEYRVRARLTTFPGVIGSDRRVIVSAAHLFDRIGPEHAPSSSLVIDSDDPDGAFGTVLWSDRDIGDLTDELAALGIEFRNPTSVDEMLAAPEFLARGWIVRYASDAMVLAVVLGAVVLSGFAGRAMRHRQLQSRVLTELGHRRGAMGIAAVVELAAVGVFAAGVGTFGAWLSARVLTRAYEPMRAQRPSMTVDADGATALTVTVVLVVVAALTAALAASSARRNPINEILRDE